MARIMIAIEVPDADVDRINDNPHGLNIGDYIGMRMDAVIEKNWSWSFAKERVEERTETSGMAGTMARFMAEQELMLQAWEREQGE